jgi:hypothetical protein
LPEVQTDHDAEMERDPRMRVAIVTNHNGIGLTRDAELLRSLLEEWGHTVTDLQWDQPVPKNLPQFDLTLFLEVVPRDYLKVSPVNFLFANPEWVKPHMVKVIDRHIHRIFTKTHEAQRILEPLFPGRTVYTGFLARDQYMPKIERKPWFLHIGGNSSLRGTEAVVDAWRWKKNGTGMDGHLIVVSTALKDRPEIPMVTYYEKLDEEELKSYQNECMFHIYPSGTEGFGHALHEAYSVGAILFTTDAPPMNEMPYIYALPATKVSKYNLADVYEVSAIDIFSAVSTARKIWPKESEGGRAFARSHFLTANEEFRKLFSEQMVEKPKSSAPNQQRKTGTGMQFAFLGNFGASESTENMIKWALEEGLGHEVETLQENEVNLATIRSAAGDADAFIWVRTPGWLRVPDPEMCTFLEDLEIPSISIHLDKFFSIPEREALIGVHPFWRAKFCFTADGSREEDFRSKNVNHFWMRPAVSEVYLHKGQPQDIYKCDVGFVGARDYHVEYKFRPQLVEFLSATYRDRFKHITGLRGHGLNDFYASCKVCVGDHIFSGIPRYFSDRAPETTGRGGFLLYPETEGLCIPCATYKPQDLDNLHAQIEFWLGQEKLRREKIDECMEHVRVHDTWTIRLKEILAVVGF